MWHIWKQHISVSAPIFFIIIVFCDVKTLFKLNYSIFTILIYKDMLNEDNYYPIIFAEQQSYFSLIFLFHIDYFLFHIGYFCFIMKFKKVSIWLKRMFIGKSLIYNT